MFSMEKLNIYAKLYSSLSINERFLWWFDETKINPFTFKKYNFSKLFSNNSKINLILHCYDEVIK